MGQKSRKKNRVKFRSYEAIEQHVKATSVMETAELLESNQQLAPEMSYCSDPDSKVPRVDIQFIFDSKVVGSPLCVENVAYGRHGGNAMAISHFVQAYLKGKRKDIESGANRFILCSIERPFVDIKGVIGVLVLYFGDNPNSDKLCETRDCNPMHDVSLEALNISKDYTQSKKSLEGVTGPLLIDFDEVTKKVKNSSVYEATKLFVKNDQISPLQKLGIEDGLLPADATATCTIGFVYNKNGGQSRNVIEETIKCKGQDILFAFLTECVKYRIQNNELCQGHTEFHSYERPVLGVEDLIAISVTVDIYRRPHKASRRHACLSIPDEIVWPIEKRAS